MSLPKSHYPHYHPHNSLDITEPKTQQPAQQGTCEPAVKLYGTYCYQYTHAHEACSIWSITAVYVFNESSGYGQVIFLEKLNNSVWNCGVCVRGGDNLIESFSNCQIFSVSWLNSFGFWILELIWGWMPTLWFFFRSKDLLWHCRSCLCSSWERPIMFSVDRYIDIEFWKVILAFIDLRVYLDQRVRCI